MGNATTWPVAGIATATEGVVGVDVAGVPVAFELGHAHGREHAP